MNALIMLMALKYATLYNVSPEVVLSVIKVESNFNANVISNGNDIGLMQLRKASYPEYTTKELLDPETNIKLGVRHLAEVKNKCKYKLNHSYVVCYNVGLTGIKNIKHPYNFPYYKKVMKQMAKLTGLFKKGDRVKIEKCYAGSNAPAWGTVLYPSQEHGYKDCYVVELDDPKGMRIPITEDRLTKEK